MSRRQKQTKDLRIRVIGVLDSTASNDVVIGGTTIPSHPRGSVIELTLNELIESEYTDEYAQESQPLWIQIENASSAQLQRIGEHFGLHPLTVEGIQTRHTREKLEIFQNYLFLVFHALHGGPKSAGGGGGLTQSAGFMDHRSAMQQAYQSGRYLSDALVDPFDLTRQQAAILAGRASVDAIAEEDGDGGDTTHDERKSDSSRSSTTHSHFEKVHEGSRLLAGQDKLTAKYYGADAARPISRSSSNLNTAAIPDPQASPLPRRHKSQPSISRSSSNASLSVPLAPGGTVLPNLNAVRTPSPAIPSPKPSRPGLLQYPQQQQQPPAPRSDSSRPTPVVTHGDRFQLPYSMAMGPDDGTPTPASDCSHSDDEEDDDDDDDDLTSPSDSETQSMTSSPKDSPKETHASRGSSNTAAKHSTDALLRDSNGPHRQTTAASPPPVVSAHAVAALSRDSQALRTNPIKLVVFPHLVLSFHSSNLDTVNSVRHRLSRVYLDSVESTAWIIHALLDSITDSLLPIVNSTSVEVDALEELIYVLSGSEHRDLLKRMGMTRRRLTFLRQRLWSKRDILMSLIGKDWQLFLAGVQIPYLRDVYDHVVTMLHKVEAASDLLVALQNTYLANVQIDVAEASNDINIVMKNLTAVGAIILPMQLVGGLFGMNCVVPWQKMMHTHWGDLFPFIAICIGMALVTIVMAAYFRKTNLA